MKRNLLTSALLSLFILLIPTSAGATKFLELKVVDKEYLMVHFRDGEVHYRDDATGPSAYLGHSFAEGDDTLLVFAPRLNPEAAVKAGDWIISSRDDKAYGSHAALQA
ncbi:MAG: glycosyl hydrolase family 5, partial [Bacteroidales bacterium]|nr:glycosyl hydrolase family 5 [Bacteroidales bacterium]